MSATRKDYVALAAAIKRQLTDARAFSSTDAEAAAIIRALREVARESASHFATGNERFDRGRFMHACGFE